MGKIKKIDRPGRHDTYKSGTKSHRRKIVWKVQPGHFGRRFK